jgi:pre-mRNA cleavage complex 2 protein Pcf11
LKFLLYTHEKEHSFAIFTRGTSFVKDALNSRSDSVPAQRLTTPIALNMSYPYAFNAQPAYPPQNRGYGNNGYNTPPTGFQAPPPQQQQPHYNGSASYNHGYSQPPPAQAGAGRSPVEAFRAYYADRLKELTFNSRPLIQDLSIMAMQQRDNGNWDNMAGVVEEIEIAVYRVRITCLLSTCAVPLSARTDSAATEFLPRSVYVKCKGRARMQSAGSAIICISTCVRASVAY